MNLLSKQLYLNKTVNIFYEEEVIEIKGEVKNFIVKTKKNLYNAKTIIIATGGGAFKPMPLGLKNESSYKNIIYKIMDSKKYIGKKLVIFGGGDTAIDWAHYFSKKGSKICLVHRREVFRGQEKLLNEIKEDINILTPYKLNEVVGKVNIKEIKIKNIKTREIKEISCDYILVFFGQKKLVLKEDPFKIEKDKNGYYVKSNMETSRNGIFAIGNVANYHGKIKMMITGLGEAATSVGAIVELLRPGKKMSYYVKKKEN